MPHCQKIIAIDGPSASGKGTIAAQVAKKLGFVYLDSGALYRVCALSCLDQQIDLDDRDAVATIAQSLPVQFKEQCIFLNDQDITNRIRDENIGKAASKIATYPQLREALLTRQRAFLTTQGLVADGRDMGSVVFPNAALKVFLTASAEVRAQRRVIQLQKINLPANFSEILSDIKKRDWDDSHRSIAPLKHFPDARFLDSSEYTIEQTVDQVLRWYQETQQKIQENRKR